MVVMVVMMFLAVSPFLTIRLFHPDGASIRWQMQYQDLLFMQISQIEPLLVSFVTLWYLLMYRNVQRILLWIVTVLAIHMAVAFFLISVRAEGALRWWLN
jgi:hypothetical protein